MTRGNEEAMMAKKAKSDDWTEVDDDSQQARENPQAAEHDKAASAQQTEMQWTELPPENVDVMPTAAVNVALNNREGREDEAKADPEQLAEQDRKADTERSEKLAKEEEAEAKKAGREPTKPAKEEANAAPEREPLPSTEELQGMRRSELDELAEARGVDISDASNKDDVIELLRKDARKRK
jgi:hypothetical protein